MNSLNQSVSRRKFLRGMAWGAAGAGMALGFPSVITRPVFGASVRNTVREGVRVGVIGVGGQGYHHVLMNADNVFAVCDVDDTHAARAKAQVEKRTKRACASYRDFRKLLEKKEIDAVLIATPDHWHALAAIYACEAGKDVYCEKPLTLVVREGRVLERIVRRTKRVFQTGSQQRSDDRFRLACELVRSGRLGKLDHIDVGLPGVNFNAKPVPDSDPPPELDYDMWLGPAPWRPYNKNRVHYNFRFFWDYSGGQMTNWGAHHLDIVQWALGMDESGPVEIEATATFDPEKRYEVPYSSEIHYTYANGVKVICRQGPGQKTGVTFYGEKGWIYVNRGKLESNPPELIKEPLGPNDVHLYVSKNHHDNWYECIKTRKLPICDVEIGHRSATVCHLGNISIRLGGRKLKWDPKKERFIGDDEANKRLIYTYRAPWKLPEV